MTKAERAYWDNFYRQQKGTRDYPAPDPILFEYVPPIPEDLDRAPRALDLACGYGQNALWMATQGYVTDAVDVSRVALAVGHVRAAKNNITNVNLMPADLDEFNLQREWYDIVVVMRFIKRGLIPTLRATVRPGGRIIYQGYNTRHLNADPNYDPEQLFRVGELMGYFADWRILHNTNSNGVSQLIAVKPA